MKELYDVEGIEIIKKLFIYSYKLIKKSIGLLTMEGV